MGQWTLLRAGLVFWVLSIMLFMIYAVHFCLLWANEALETIKFVNPITEMRRVFGD